MARMKFPLLETRYAISIPMVTGEKQGVFFVDKVKAKGRLPGAQIKRKQSCDCFLLCLVELQIKA